MVVLVLFFTAIGLPVFFAGGLGTTVLAPHLISRGDWPEGIVVTLAYLPFVGSGIFFCLLLWRAQNILSFFIWGRKWPFGERVRFLLLGALAAVSGWSRATVEYYRDEQALLKRGLLKPGPLLSREEVPLVVARIWGRYQKEASPPILRVRRLPRHIAGQSLGGTIVLASRYEKEGWPLDLILHELAHELVGRGKGHGPKFRNAAMRLFREEGLLPNQVSVSE